MLRSIAQLLRPKQWIKNGFVLAPLLFSGVFNQTSIVIQALYAAFLFCLTSSLTYVINDIHDIEQDKKHPIKSKTRPLASGKLSLRTAYCVIGILSSILLAQFFLVPKVACMCALYMLLTLSYTFKLKYIPVLDLFAIASGFVLRVYTGAVAIDVPVSNWMFITTLCIALYLAAMKRQQEQLQHGSQSRTVLAKYTPKLLNYYAEMSATGTLLFYSIFILSNRPELFATIPFVLFGLFRYAYLVEIKQSGESPADAFFADPILMLTVFSWLAVCLYSLRPLT